MGVVGRQGLAMVECKDMQIECFVHKGGDGKAVIFFSEVGVAFLLVYRTSSKIYQNLQYQ